MKPIIKKPWRTPEDKFKFMTTNVTFNCVEEIFHFSKQSDKAGIERRLIKNSVKINAQNWLTWNRNEAVRKTLTRNFKKTRKISFDAMVKARVFGANHIPLGDISFKCQSLAGISTPPLFKRGRKRWGDDKWTGFLPPSKRARIGYE